MKSRRKSYRSKSKKVIRRSKRSRSRVRHSRKKSGGKKPKDDSRYNCKIPSQRGQEYVFTGFRNKSLEQAIIKSGGKIGSNVNKRTTAVIRSDDTTVSGKLTKARNSAIKIYKLSEFKRKFKCGSKKRVNMRLIDEPELEPECADDFEWFDVPEPDGM